MPASAAWSNWSSRPERRCPPTSGERNYLWREYLQKADLDRYIQLDVNRQNEHVDAVLAQLKTAFDRDDVDGALSQLADVELPAPSPEMLRLKSEADRLGRESDRLFGVRNEGLFNLKQDYVGFGWLKREIRRAGRPPRRKNAGRSSSGSSYYEDPGEGGFYDNAGDPEKSPHLVYGWPYGDGIISHDNRPSQRKMAFTTDEERGVTFQYDNLDRAGSISRPPRSRAAALRPPLRRPPTSKGRIDLRRQYSPRRRTSSCRSTVADFFEFDIPQAATSDGKLTLWLKKQPGIGEGLKSDVTVWRNTGGWGTLVSEVWLMKKGAGRAPRIVGQSATGAAQ